MIVTDSSSGGSSLLSPPWYKIYERGESIGTGGTPKKDTRDSGKVATYIVALIIHIIGHYPYFSISHSHGHECMFHFEKNNWGFIILS